jgi:hypothetical protein
MTFGPLTLHQAPRAKSRGACRPRAETLRA